jgi:hypothetical protein
MDRHKSDRSEIFRTMESGNVSAIHRQNKIRIMKRVGCHNAIAIWIVGKGSIILIDTCFQSEAAISLFFSAVHIKLWVSDFHLFSTHLLIWGTARANFTIARSESSHPRLYLTQWCALIIMNDCIRQIISSSPISLSKIFVAPTTSAPALVLRTSM